MLRYIEPRELRQKEALFFLHYVGDQTRSIESEIVLKFLKPERDLNESLWEDSELAQYEYEQEEIVVLNLISIALALLER